MAPRGVTTLGLMASVLLSACTTTVQQTILVRKQPVQAAGYDVARDLGPLFHDIQMARLYTDSKTFVDAKPLEDPKALLARYAAEKGQAGFDLRAFATKWFTPPAPAPTAEGSATTTGMEQHIRDLWPLLTRAADVADPRSTLIPLPKPYVVPGGRFREVYYWDSYFTMLGLIESKRTDLVGSMLDNFAHLIVSVGHIPNGNRTYYLSRSQPPYFAAMAGLYATATDTSRALQYLEAMEQEYRFWMEGSPGLPNGEAYRRVVRMRDGSLLNRYYDDRPEPRPESYREDYELAQQLPEARREAFYRNVRAAAESGWDFSSRWMRDTTDLKTLETINLVPVDLNSLLYHAERTIAALHRFRNGEGDAAAAQAYETAAQNRKRAILATMWDAKSGFFYDYRFATGERVTDRPTMAAAAPLFFGLATAEQGTAVAARLEREFLRPGGFVTTTIRSGQQWDAPNGWPPLQWVGMEGVRRYGRADLADLARDRWLTLGRRTYAATGKMTEKYDVLDLSRKAGGGEYPNQDGFGWTNGVALALATMGAVR